MRAAGRICREAWASARALRGYSLVFAAIGFAVIAGLTVTVGQGLAQKAAVLTTFEAPDLRTFTLSDEEDTGALPWAMVQRATSLSTVEVAWMSTAAIDVRNSSLSAGDAVPARAVAGAWSRLPVDLVAGRWPTNDGEAVIDLTAARTGGLAETFGGVRTGAGREWSIVGAYIPTHPRAPSGVLYSADAADDRPTFLHVTVDDVRLMDDAVAMVVAASDATRPGQVRIDRSADIAELQASVSGSLTEHGTTIVLGVMLGSALVLSLVSVLMVNARRQEFGRRRALGATRSMVVALVVVQGFMVIAAGSLSGGAAAAAYLWVRHSIVVPLDFCLWVVVAASLGGVVAQLPSAVAAGLRDPVRVLRTP